MSEYAPQTDEFDLSDATTEELGQAIELYNALVPASRRLDPRRTSGMGAKAEKHVSLVFASLRRARGASAQYVVDRVAEMLDQAVDLGHFKAMFVGAVNGSTPEPEEAEA